MMFTVLKFVATATFVSFTLVSARADFHDALSPLPGISYKIPKPGHRSSTTYKVTKTNFQRLHAVRGDGTNSRSAAAILGSHQRAVPGGGGYQNITSATALGTQYALDIVLQDTPMQVYLDTGSSDTWFVQQDFICTDYGGVVLPQEACGFGPGFAGEFQYGAIPGQHCFILYGDGEMVYGPVGYSDITVANITVKRQEVALANTTYWYGNNVTSGVLGLAYPSLTNAYLGTGMEHDWLDAATYPPLFSTMVSDGLVQPFFAVAINRNSSGGLIGFGGIPPISGLDYSTAATTDIIIVSPEDHGSQFTRIST